MTPNDAARRPMPLVGAITAGPALQVIVTWSAGSRTGKTESLDLAPIINAGKFFRPLRDDRDLLESVHVIAFGNAIAWGDDDAIDLSATSLERLAEETMTSQDLRTFLATRNITETALAASLDYSRRQIVNFANGDRPIPRVVALACRYIEIQNLFPPSLPVPEHSGLLSVGNERHSANSAARTVGTVALSTHECAFAFSADQWSNMVLRVTNYADAADRYRGLTIEPHGSFRIRIPSAGFASTVSASRFKEKMQVDRDG